MNLKEVYDCISAHTGKIMKVVYNGGVSISLEVAQIDYIPQTFFTREQISIIGSTEDNYISIYSSEDEFQFEYFKDRLNKFKRGDITILI